MKPVGTVLGWNAGDERAAVLQATSEGHVVVPCDWALNVPALSVGADEAVSDLPRFGTPSAASQSRLPGVALVMSDGDNLQWMLTSFTHNANYWANEQRAKHPFTWGLPVADLVHLAPDVYRYLVETQGARTSILCHFGYWYPDRFAEARGARERQLLLEEVGRQCEKVFAKTGTHFLTFLADDPGSSAARESYQVLARTSPSMTGMFAIAYDPYEGGEGKTYWADSSAGRRIPVTTAAYALWQTTSKKRPFAGDPEMLSRKILQAASPGSVDWVIVHAWSEFAPPAGIAKFLGVGPTVQLADLLEGKVEILTAEALVDRLKPAP